MNNQLDYLGEIASLLPGNVYWKNRKGIYLGCNESNAKTLGYSSSKDIVGKTIFEIFGEHMHQYAELIDKTDNEIMSSNCERTLEEYGRNKDGSILVYLTKKTPIHDDQGNVIGLLGVSLDFSAWKKIEGELQNQIKVSEQNRQITNTYLANMLANLPENFYWMDKESNILGCNENQAKLFGLESSQQLLGKNIYDIAKIVNWKPEVAEKIRQNDIKVMETRKTITIEEEIILDGMLRTFVSYKNPLIGANNEVIGVFGVSIDITERKKFEKALVDALQKAEAANIAKSNFIRNMSHDLRTPFGGILGFATYLENIESDHTKKEYLGYIKLSCEKLLNLINEIISLTSLETGEQKIQPEPTNIKQIILDVETLMLAQIKNKNLEFFYNINKNVPEEIIIDKMRIHRIILNLVSNAIKFTEKGTVSITVSLNDINSDNKTANLNIIISDTGIGIPDNKLNVIFERFTRLTDSFEGKYEGTGLGLYIVKQLLNELGGTIEVESQLNVGSKFKCQLPCGLLSSTQS